MNQSGVVSLHLDPTGKGLTKYILSYMHASNFNNNKHHIIVSAMGARNP